MSHTGNIRTTALVTLALALGTSVPAYAGDDDGGDDRDGLVLALTESTVATLAEHDVELRPLGKAVVKSHDADVYIAFPARDDDGVTRWTGDDRDDVLRLLGGLELDGADGTSTWTRLRVNRGRDFISAVVDGGDRTKILRLDEHDNDHYHRGGDGDDLELTLAGAQSLNRAAPDSPFATGDEFAAALGGC